MASFTDQLLPYTPYVAQLPVQAMKEVGMYKQAQYNEGVEKIQGQIDDVAGLDVVRDVDKQYLQSRLNELGNNLTKVAAGDFSNYQLVNSIGGMTKQIVKDPHIQNAVSSTIRYRKGVSDMETAKKEGKSSPSNEWDFQNQASQWFNNKDIKAGFSGGYNPYTNYKKNALDAIKSLTKDESITDDAFTLDGKGNLVIADAIVRKKLAGIDPGKIQQALMATLSPADFKQMEIDGRYTYSNVSPEQFSQSLKSSYKTKADFYNEQKRILENAKSSTTSVLQKNKLDEQISSLQKVLGGISEEQKQMDDALAHGNIEGVKAQLHTSNFLNNFSKAFSYTETSNTYETNPFAKAAQWRQEQARDWDKFLINTKLKVRELDIQAAKAKKETEALYGGLPQPVNQELLPKTSTGVVLGKTLADANLLSTVDSSFLGNKKKNEEWFNQQKQAWERNPHSGEDTVAYHLRGTEPLRRTIEANKAMLLKIQKEAGKELGIGDPSDYVNKMIPKNAPDIQYSDGNVQFTYTPKDFVDYNTQSSKYISSGGSGGTGGYTPPTFDFKKAKEELPPKLYHLLEIQSGKQPLSNVNEQLLKTTQEYNNIVNRPYNDVLNKIDEISQEKLKERVTSSQGMEYGIQTGKPENKQQMGSNLVGLANIAEKTNGKLPMSPDFDVTTAKKLGVNPDTQYRLSVVEGSEFQPSMYELTATGDVAGKSLSTRAFITPEQKVSMFGQQFEAQPEIQAIKPYLEQIRKMGGYSTAFTDGDSNHENAFLSSIDFPAVSTYGMKANIETPDNNVYQLKLSIFDPEKQVWHENISYPSKMISKNAIYQALTGLNDSAIYELLNETPATEKDIKRVKSASQKPF